MSITLRLSDGDMELIKNYAAMKGSTVSEVMRRAILEKIEDEIDLEGYQRAMAAHRANPVTYSHDEVGKMLGFK